MASTTSEPPNVSAAELTSLLLFGEPPFSIAMRRVPPRVALETVSALVPSNETVPPAATESDVTV